MVRLTALFAAAALALGACSGSTPTTAPSAAPASAGGGGGGGATAVAIKDFLFDPASISVKVGGTVEWANQGGTAHTVDLDDASVSPPSGNLAVGAKFPVTFSKAGSFTYHCAIHGNMKGTVVVS
jgi:plastocyanin